MSDRSIESLINQCEMGQAYKRITAKAGPDAQLLAFVNHDEMKSSDIALESFDLTAAHEQVLAEIDADPSFSIACENFIGRIQSGAARMKNFITGSKRGNDLTEFKVGTLVPRENAIFVESFTEFQKFLDVHKQLAPLFNYILKAIPRSHNLEAWNAFGNTIFVLGAKSNFGKNDDQIKELGDSLLEGKILSKVDFDVSGWNAENFRAAIVAYEDEIKKTLNSVTVAESILGDMMEVIGEYEEADEETSESTTSPVSTGRPEMDETGKAKPVVVQKTKTVTKKKNPETTVALKAMNKAYDSLWGVYLSSGIAESRMRKTLKDVSHHFEVK